MRSKEKTEENDPFTDKEKFRNRRRMAWVSLAAIFAIISYVFLFMESSQVEDYENVISWTMGILASVVLGYMGSTSFVGVFGIKKTNVDGN